MDKGSFGFKAWGGMDVAYVCGKRYPVGSPLFNRVPAKVADIMAPTNKAVIIGAATGGYTRVWDKRGELHRLMILQQVAMQGASILSVIKEAV